MRILLDECIPHQLRTAIVGHEVTTVQYRGWSGVKNGELLSKMRAAQIEVLVTRDGNLSFQQNVASSGISVVLLMAPTNDVVDLRPLLPRLLVELSILRPGQVVEVRQ
jgi:predicted nuclease of predicted toxin-antitoxin system